jgi:hypothetical protein
LGETDSLADVMKSLEVICLDVCLSDLFLLILSLHFVLFLLVYWLRWSDHTSSLPLKRSEKQILLYKI